MRPEQRLAGLQLACLSGRPEMPCSGGLVATGVPEPFSFCRGFADSKKLTEAKREELFVLMAEQKIAWATDSLTATFISEQMLQACARSAKASDGPAAMQLCVKRCRVQGEGELECAGDGVHMQTAERRATEGCQPTAGAQMKLPSCSAPHLNHA